MRDVVIHYHIFKNSGSTIDMLLQRAFGEQSWAGVENTVPRHTMPAEDVANIVFANPMVRVISSHTARLPPPRVEGIAFHPMLFLRHPIDRVGSVYAFERRQPAGAQGIGIEVARREDLAGYVRWRLAEGNGSVIRNFQVVHLSAQGGDLRFAVAGRHHLQRAVDVLRSLPFFGLVEYFDESLLRLGTYLRPFSVDFGASDHLVAANATPGRAPTLSSRVAEIEAMLGPDLYAELLEHNQLDLALYSEAQRLFHDAQQREAVLGDRGSLA